MEKDYIDYNASDFLSDSSFLEWIRGEKQGSVSFWEDWIRKHPDKLETVRSAREQYDLLTSFEKTKPAPGEQEGVWKGIEENIDQKTRSQIHRVRKFRWAAVAAAVACLVVGGWVIYKQMNLTGERFVVVKTENGKKQIMLPDSSMVVLNKDAVLKYDKDNYRELWLKGEAFFNIKHLGLVKSAATPFTVHAGVEKITVLGTAFTVKTIQQGASVVLLRGKVRTSVKEHSVIMKPGDKTAWENGRFKTERVDPQLYLAWKTGEFHFNHTSLKELKEVVKDMYGYDLVIKNESLLGTKTISGTVSAKDEAILWKTISLMFDVSVEKKGKQIVLTAH